MRQKELRLKHVKLSHKYRVNIWISNSNNMRYFATSFFPCKGPCIVPWIEYQFMVPNKGSEEIIDKVICLREQFREQ